jgi:hypothetical protein
MLRPTIYLPSPLLELLRRAEAVRRQAEKEGIPAERGEVCPAVA